MNKYYTGVGSRETPLEIIELIKIIARKLSLMGYILRSGGADGSDNAFEIGCDVVNGKKDIYLPWRGFNKSNSPLFNVCPKALDLASKIHPAWGKLSQGAKKLHARNCYQVLGEDLNEPSKVLICWTKNGEKIGGTRTAIVLAEQNNIPVYNLAITEHLNKLKEKLKI